MCAGISQVSVTSLQFPSQHSIISRDESENVFPLEESEFPSTAIHSHHTVVITGAPSLVGYEDDCCISYTVTIIDVRSCTRCTRVPVGQLSSDTNRGMYPYIRRMVVLYIGIIKVWGFLPKNPTYKPA